MFLWSSLLNCGPYFDCKTKPQNSQPRDGAIRQYVTSQRDACLACILDCARSSGNAGLSIALEATVLWCGGGGGC